MQALPCGRDPAIGFGDRQMPVSHGARVAFIFAATILVVALLYGVLWPVGGFSANEPTGIMTTRTGAAGTFKPTKEEWAGLVIEEVAIRMFRPEEITEGSI